jgi:hypothetical protein
MTILGLEEYFKKLVDFKVLKCDCGLKWVFYETK